MNVLSEKNQESIFAYNEWQNKLNALSSKYKSGQPYPHIVLDHFLNQDVAEQALQEFPSLDSTEWVNYLHVNEKKFGKTDLSSFPSTLKAIVQELNSDRFVQFLSGLTGIKGLMSDESLEGGGLHQTCRGGFLNVHADFTGHPHQKDWRRRINVLVYLNKNWEVSYGGQLELWDKKMKRRIKKVMPIFNRCVIFTTDKKTYHGHPIPLACPEGVTRKSIALYYFTKESDFFHIRSTDYKPRPHDTFNRIWIYLDRTVLWIYDKIKRRLRIKDTFASKLLRFFHRKK